LTIGVGGRAVSRLPIRVRLSASYCVFLALTLVALGAFLVLQLRSDLRSNIDHELQESAAAIGHTYTTKGAADFPEISAASLGPRRGAAQVLNPSGAVILQYGRPFSRRPMIRPVVLQAALAGHAELLDLDFGPDREPFRVRATTVSGPSGKQVLVVARTLEGIGDTVSRVLILLLIAGPVALVIFGLAGWWLVRTALVPVDRMRAKAEQIGIDHLHERLSASHPTDELGQLASTLNAMLDRLEAGVAAKRQLIADASHELRAPLAAMRAELDISITDAERSPAEQATLLSVREDVDRLSRTVDNLLTLASADEGRLELLPGRVDLLQSVEEAARPLRALADAKEIQMRIDGEPYVAHADRQRLHQALTNLIENAIKFTPKGGAVTATTWREDGQLCVSVADTGPGIPAEARAHVFDRFYRADRSRSRASGGTGLGLAICSEIATAHGGTIRVESEEGAGSVFTLALPAGEVPDKERAAGRVVGGAAADRQHDAAADRDRAAPVAGGGRERGE
jgi:heavy metal sensor kinase